MKLKKAIKNKKNQPSYPHFKEFKHEGRNVLREIAVAVATIAATGTIGGTLLTGCGDDKGHRTAGVAPISGSVDSSATSTGAPSWIGQTSNDPVKKTDNEVQLGGKPVQPVEPRLRGDIATVAMPDFPKKSDAIESPQALDTIPVPTEASLLGGMVNPEPPLGKTRPPLPTYIEPRTGGAPPPPVKPSTTSDK